MKIILSLATVALGLNAQAGILAGPIVNPLNGHSYYLLSQNTWSNAEAEAVALGGHLATIRNAAEDRLPTQSRPQPAGRNSTHSQPLSFVGHPRRTRLIKFSGQLRWSIHNG